IVAVQTTALALRIGRRLQAVIEILVLLCGDADGDVAIIYLLHPQLVLIIGAHDLAHMVVVAISRVPSQRIEGPIDVLALENTQENPARRVPDLPVTHRAPPLLRSGPPRLSVAGYTASAGQGQGIFSTTLP